MPRFRITIQFENDIPDGQVAKLLQDNGEERLRIQVQNLAYTPFVELLREKLMPDGDRLAGIAGPIDEEDAEMLFDGSEFEYSIEVVND